MRTGRVAVQNLDEKEMEGDHWIEAALAPRVADTATDCQNGGGFELCGPILLELFHDFCNGEGHLGSPVCGVNGSPICTGELGIMEAKLSVVQKPTTSIYKRRYPYLNAILDRPLFV